MSSTHIIYGVAFRFGGMPSPLMVLNQLDWRQNVNKDGREGLKRIFRFLSPSVVITYAYCTNTRGRNHSSPPPPPRRSPHFGYRSSPFLPFPRNMEEYGTRKVTIFLLVARNVDME